MTIEKPKRDAAHVVGKRHSPHPFKRVLLWACLVGLPIGAFWIGGCYVEGTRIAKYAWSGSRLGQLALALQIYHHEHGAFPPTRYQPKTNGPIHSWRVLLVPQTSGASEAYSNYDFSQEWNSSNNLQALNGVSPHGMKGNIIFRMIRDAHGDVAHYLAIGEDDEWPSRKPLNSRLVTKGKDRFLLIEYPDSKIHWMEPKY